MSSTQPSGAASDRVLIADRVIGTILVFATVIAIVAARSAAFLLPILTVVALALTLAERNRLEAYLQPSRPSLSIAIFLGLAAASAIWSADGWATLTYVAPIAGVLLQWHVVNRWVWTQRDYRLRHLAYWVPIAVLLGSLALLFEVFGDQHLRRFLIDNFGILTPPTLKKHWDIDAFGRSHIREFELNRSVAAANMLLWPAILCALSWWRGRSFAIMATALGASVFLATMGSDHETSKLAIIAGLVCFGVALVRLRFAVLATAAAWVLLLVAVPYASHIAYSEFALHKAPWMQYSARERIVIWSDIAYRVQQAPLLGVGARTGYVLSNRTKASLTPPTNIRARTVARHAHNVFLQTWFELGIAGAAVLLVAGLTLLRSITRLDERVQPYALATFSVFMIEIASTWEIWQRWYAALFALTAIYLAIGIRSLAATERARAGGGEAPAALPTPAENGEAVPRDA